MANPQSWQFSLCTIHLLEGFLPMPPGVRSAYPPSGTGEGDREVLRGLWYDSDERLWLWLDRKQDRLYGPDLAQKLEWLEAGDRLRIQWTAEVVILRLAGTTMRCRRSRRCVVVQALLSTQPEGLTFAQVVQALRERQGHDVPRNTVRAILYVGGFLHHDDCWFAVPQSEHGGRRLQAALADALAVNQQPDPATTPTSQTERRRKQVQAIRTRLAELVNVLREGLQSAD